jgi:hypothetical protein
LQEKLHQELRSKFIGLFRVPGVELAGAPGHLQELVKAAVLHEKEGRHQLQEQRLEQLQKLIDKFQEGS